MTNHSHRTDGDGLSLRSSELFAWDLNTYEKNVHNNRIIATIQHWSGVENQWKHTNFDKGIDLFCELTLGPFYNNKIWNIGDRFAVIAVCIVFKIMIMAKPNKWLLKFKQIQFLGFSSHSRCFQRPSLGPSLQRSRFRVLKRYKIYLSELQKPLNMTYFPK